MVLKHKSYLTAISRKTLPLPTRWLLSQSLVNGRVLDYGCGKCFKINPSTWHNYDPYHCPTTYWQWYNCYETIICNYVLCTLPAEERKWVLLNIQNLLTNNGIAYLSVRNDKPKQGWGLSARKTYQGRAQELKLNCIRTCSTYRIYRLTKKDKIV